MSAPTSALAKDLRAAGKASKYTRSRLPVKRAYSEPKRSKSAALKREALIKKLRRAEKEVLVAEADNGRPTRIKMFTVSRTPYFDINTRSAPNQRLG